MAAGPRSAPVTAEPACRCPRCSADKPRGFRPMRRKRQEVSTVGFERRLLRAARRGSSSDPAPPDPPERV